ncbi:MAG: hypothetical protein KF723_05335 [Rhizobiaceae bacterium]|nr:hypothetical protein [Rhizobiaceae bacterium]
MRLLAWFAVVLPMLVPAAVPAFAFMLYPDRDNPDALIVLVERPYGDLVEFRMLPKPYDDPLQSTQGPDSLSYRWQYARAPQQGMAFLTVDEDGLGTMHFEFWGEELADGDTLAAAAVLVDRDGKALHSFYARADHDRSGFGGAARAQLRLPLDRPPGWWQEVGGIAFFYMKYFAQQRPDDDGVWVSMERAVELFTRGEGTSQRG